MEHDLELTAEAERERVAAGHDEMRDGAIEGSERRQKPAHAGTEREEL